MRDVRLKVNAFRARHGREPEAGEVGATVEDWDRWQDVTHVVSVHEDPNTEELSGTLADDSSDSDATAAGVDFRAKLAGEMAAMSPRNRELVRLFFIEGRTLDDVAEDVGISHTRAHELRKILEGRLRKVLAA